MGGRRVLTPGQVLGQPHLPPECRAAHWFVCPCWTSEQVTREDLIILYDGPWQHGAGDGGVRNFTHMLVMVCQSRPVVTVASFSHQSCALLSRMQPLPVTRPVHRGALWSPLAHPNPCIPMHRSAPWDLPVTRMAI